jgi:hypothetical protein
MVTFIGVRVTMTAPNHMFKVDLSRSLKNANGYIF